MQLNDIELFKDLTTIEQARLLGKIERMELAEGTLLFEQGDAGDKMFMIVRGKVELFTGAPGERRQALTFLEAGAVFGEMALLSGNPRSTSAMAATDTILYAINQEAFNELLAENSTVALYLVRLLSQRLVQTNRSLQESRMEKKAIIEKELMQLPEGARQALLSASVIPTPAPAWLWRADDMDQLWASQANCHHMYALSASNEADAPPGALVIHIDPAIKKVLKSLYESRNEEAVRNAFIFDAVGAFQAKGLHRLAAQTCIENGFWTEAVALVDGIGNGETADEAGRKELLRLFAACPDLVLFSHYTFFCSYLEWLRQDEPESALRKVALAIDQPGDFSQEQLGRLYTLAADLYEEQGMRHKALECLNLAGYHRWRQNGDGNDNGTDEDVARGLAVDGRAEGDPKGGATGGLTGRRVKATLSDRLYSLTRQSLQVTNSARLVEQSKKLIQKNTLFTAATVLFALALLGYFNAAEPFAGLSAEGMRFLGVSLAAVVFWMADIVPAFIVALLMLLAWVLAGLVKPAVALSGFASPTWIYMLCILALGAAINKSGLMFRLSLLLIKSFPRHYGGQLLGIALSGILFSPLIPSSTAKVALAGPISRSIADSMGFPDRSRGSAGLSLMAMVFYGYLCPFFLTGTYSNMMAFGLVQQETISWLEWLYYALPALLVFSAGMFGLVVYLFKPEKPATVLSTDVLEQQLKTLGPLTREEKITIAVTLGSIAMMILQTWHQIDNAWVMSLGFALLVILRVLDEATMKSGIDWLFLLFIGVAFGFAEVASQLGVVKWIADLFADFLQPFMVSPYLFLAVIITVVFLITLVVRDDPAVILLILAITPLASQAGIHPWILVFVILLTTDPFFFPYQSPTYLMTYYCTEEKAFSHRQGQWVAIAYAVMIYLSVLISVPYWRLLGLIR
ncbi:cyclic nucleotide-binding domain-containing protein [Heliobacterium gestii]|uniref:Sodium-dependent dicarboxylate transporter SdcS n=1 Tax=Heliomicrobium gestii TaxID=2699 RepID=A0A845L9I8_HELGE|nr:SLC13 family permease [Heliomicrobium gestii]MBM7868209.1 anion transporter [Heliomicrobium gestii]MZP43407.1 cyclic nucleotide-binding domain-containing protein [Heliomicrobium gestii]